MIPPAGLAGRPWLPFHLKSVEWDLDLEFAITYHIDTLHLYLMTNKSDFSIQPFPIDHVLLVYNFH